MKRMIVGIVLYNPTIEIVINTINNLETDASSVVAYNNGATISDLKSLSDIGVNIIGSGDNVGIAKALNSIMEFALSYDKTTEWVFVSDQDANYSKNILCHYEKYLDQDDVGIICPNIIKNSEELPAYNSKEISEIKRCPTSGMAMRTCDWEKIGGYNDDLFIDYVDYDICEKVILLGKKIVRINNAYLIQSLGKINRVMWIYKLGQIFDNDRIKKMSMIFNHSPKRNYYFVRNGIIYIRTYAKDISVLKEMLYICKWELKKLIFESQKIQQVGAIFKGIKEGLKYEILKND